MVEEFNYGKIDAIATLREKASEINLAIKELSEPILDDFDYLPVLYNLFLGIFENRGIPFAANKVYHRKKFLLIILYLYSPITLAGGKMRVGLRDRLAKLFNLTATTPISDNCSDLLFQYNQYRDFRHDVDTIYQEMISALPYLDFATE